MKSLTLLMLCAMCALVACDKPAEVATSSVPDVDVAKVKQDAEEKAAEVKKDVGADKKAAVKEAKEAVTGLGMGSTPEDIKPGESNVYGNTFTIKDAPITLASAIKKAGSDGEGPYKVEATVEKVCQAKGCWFTLKAADVPMPIRVKMKDYKFFVPRNASDLPVVLEGTFKQVTVSQEEAQHYADDEAANTGKPARKIDGPQESWAFTAVAVQIDKKS